MPIKHIAMYVNDLEATKEPTIVIWNAWQKNDKANSQLTL